MKPPDLGLRQNTFFYITKMRRLSFYLPHFKKRSFHSSLDICCNSFLVVHGGCWMNKDTAFFSFFVKKLLVLKTFYFLVSI